MTPQQNEQLKVLEAMLFAAQNPLTPQAIHERLPTDADLNILLNELRGQYSDRGIQLVEIGGAWAFRTSPDVAAALTIEKDVERKLSRAALETLAVIAYHQPVTREVVKGIRGVNSDGVIASLVDKGLVRELGRDPQRGQAIIYGTTNAFLEKFGLRSTRDLPDLEQFAPDEQSRQFIRERLSGRSIQSTLEEQAEDLDEERELLDTDVEDVEAVEDLETLVVDETSEDLHDEH